MSAKHIVPFIFEDKKDVEAILGDSKTFDIHEAVLDYGLSTKKLLYLDYKGEEGNEIVHYMLDYESLHNVELAAQDELEELGDHDDYEYLPEKIKAVNKIIATRGYGLFTYPTFSDYYALFIAKLEHKAELLRVDLLLDDDIPEQERFIQYYD
ncbi:DUF6630 family protein [Paenibacillus sp. y28]|uniref:DUF6630 family protein n=1 Tax=Paenibacillus sp. y28 TaxID=3129110 RepID=UPI00301A4CCE